MTVVSVDNHAEVSLHLKLPGDLPLEEAHSVASEVERAIAGAIPEVSSVQTHLEPLGEAGEAVRPRAVEVASDAAEVARIVRAATGAPPRELRFLYTDEGLVVFLTLGLEPETPLAEAHASASSVEEEIRSRCPDVADVIVHTEP